MFLIQAFQEFCHHDFLTLANVKPGLVLQRQDVKLSGGGKGDCHRRLAAPV